MQYIVGAVAAGFFKILGVNLLDIGIFMGLSDGQGFVVSVQSRTAHGTDIHIVPNGSRLDGLTAAVDTSLSGVPKEILFFFNLHCL